MDYPVPVSRLIDELRKLPGIGPKSAQRIAFHLLRGTREDASRLAEAIATLLDGVRSCSICHAVTDREVCAHCSDPTRSDRTICVVEEPHDVLAVEKTRDFRGRYHVLHGALSPLQGIGPDELRIATLLDRVRAGSEQWAQTSRSVTAWQTEHERTPSRRVAIASDRRAASSRVPRRRWKAILWADFGPTPGSFRSSSIRRETGAG